MAQDTFRLGRRIVTLRLVETDEDVREFNAWLSGRATVAVDTETTGLEWWHPEMMLRTVQFGDEKIGWTLLMETHRDVIASAFSNTGMRFVFHHAKFDLHWLEAAGLPSIRDRFEDTMILAHLVDERLPIGLKDRASRVISWDAQGLAKELAAYMKGGKVGWQNIMVDAFWRYAALDAVLTYSLWDHGTFQQWVDKPIYKMERALVLVLMDMEQRGLHVDVEYCRTTAEGWRREQNEIGMFLATEHKIMNIASHHQVSNALIRAGAADLPRTPKGLPSTSEEALAASGHPLAEKVTRWRKLNKLCSAYLDNMIGMVGEDGLLHPDMRQFGARTGRMSVVRPAMQTIPRGDTIRNAIVAPPGKKILAVDYSQIELRMLAHFAEGGTGPMTEAIRAGEDLHNFAARRVFGENYTPEQRTLCKNTVFAMVYGAGTNKMAQTSGVSVAQMDLFLQQYSAAFPAARSYLQNIQRIVGGRRKKERLGYVQTPYGRMHRSEEQSEDYRLGNFLLQGTAADLMKTTMVRLAEEGLDEGLILSIHDELLWEVDEKMAEDFAKAVTEVMEESDLFHVPIKCGAPVISDRWGAK